VPSGASVGEDCARDPKITSDRIFPSGETAYLASSAGGEKLAE
jgi:hypothetical protein